MIAVVSRLVVSLISNAISSQKPVTKVQLYQCAPSRTVQRHIFGRKLNRDRKNSHSRQYKKILADVSDGIRHSSLYRNISVGSSGHEEV